MTDTNRLTEQTLGYVADGSVIVSNDRVSQMARELLAYRNAGVAVKPLEWDHQDYAKDAWGGYYITQNIRDQYGWAHSSRGDWDDSQPDVWETADDAKQAAQADYASRILGALVTPPPTSRVDADLRAENERLLKAVEFYANPANWIDTPDWDGPDTATPKAVPVLSEPFGSRPCDCGDTARAALSTPAPSRPYEGAAS